MQDIILYLILMSIAAFIGSKIRKGRPDASEIEFIGIIQSVATCCILFLMGSRIGSNQEVIDNLGTIGIYAVIATLCIFFFNILVLTLTRRIMGFTQRGEYIGRSSLASTTDRSAGSSTKIKAAGNHTATNHTASNPIDSSAPKGSFDKMTFLIIAFVILGFVAGHLFVPRLFSDYDYFSNLASLLIKIGLCILLFFVGFDLGYEGTALDNFKKVGVKILVFPLATIIGTLLGGLVSSFFLPLTTKESIAVAAGFGWYSLAPAIIIDAGHVTASAISFLHNVLRELISIIAVPFVARYIGFIEAAGTPGAPSMDICLPVVERSTNSIIAVYAFVIGVITSVLVPILVPFFV